MPHPVTIGVLVAFAITAAAWDLAQRRIPNALIATAALAAVALQIITLGPAAALSAIAGFATGVALLFLPFAAGGIGAGDVKFLGAIGAFLTPFLTLIVFMLGAGLGALIALVQLARAGRLHAAARWIGIKLMVLATAPSAEAFADDSPGDPSQGLPYAVPFAAAAITVGVLAASGAVTR